MPAPFNLPKVQKRDGKGELVFDDKKKPVMIDQKVMLDRTGVVRVSLPALCGLVDRWQGSRGARVRLKGTG